MTNRYNARLTKQDKKIGKRLKMRRKAQKLTQEQLAEKANVSLHHICYIENGARRPSLPLLRRLARILKVDVGELIS